MLAWHFGFGRPVPVTVHVDGSPNWVHLLTADASADAGPGLPVYREVGVGLVGRGSFDLLCFIRNLRSSSVSDLKVIDEDLDTEITVDVRLPASFEMSKYPENALGKVFLSAEGVQGGIDVIPPDSGSTELTNAIAAPITASKPSLFFGIPERHVLRMKFVERKVGEATTGNIPTEFAIQSPIAVDFGTPKQTLSEQRANTWVLCFHENIKAEDRRVETSNDPDLLVNPTKLLAIARGVRLTVGNMTRHGNITTIVKQPSHMFPIWLSREASLPFQFAVTPDISDTTAPTWLCMSGGTRRMYLSGPSCSFSAGDTKRALDSTDRLDLSGEFVYRIEFQPPTLPRLVLDGKAVSCKVNDSEILLTRWGRINPNVRGGLVGGIAGFLLSWVVRLYPQRTRGPRNRTATNALNRASGSPGTGSPESG